MKRKLSVMFLSLFMVSMGFCQQAQFFDTIFDSEELNWSQAATLVLVGAEMVDENFTENEVWAVFAEQGWFKTVPEKIDTITVSKFCFVIAKAFNVKGGILYTFFPSARYSLRQLNSDGVVSTDYDPTETLSGTDAMFILQSALNTYSVTGGRK